MYVLGTGYVTSYMAVAHGLERSWVRDGPGMTPWEQSLWRAIAAETKGYDPATRVVDMGTVPRDPRTEPPRDPRVLARYREYLAQNPRWTEGYTCLVFARVGWADALPIARALGRRGHRPR
jgi:hypothetical protein